MINQDEFFIPDTSSDAFHEWLDTVLVDMERTTPKFKESRHKGTLDVEGTRETFDLYILDGVFWLFSDSGFESLSVSYEEFMGKIQEFGGGACE